MYRLSFMAVAVLLLGACSNNQTVKENLLNCNFQMQSVQNLPSSQNKVVVGYRTCEKNSLTTHEIQVFQSGEAIDNRKQCNVFSTSDTTATWDMTLGANLIEVRFTKAPADSSILLQQQTVYDSIKVVYSVTSIQ